MATAEELRAEFTSFMDKEDIPFKIVDREDNIVRLSFGGREHKGGGADTTIYVDFDEKEDEADSVHFVAQRFAKCTMENFPVVLMKINDYNTRYRWVKFFVRREEDAAYLFCDSDALLVPGASALECVRSAFRMSDILEDVILDLGDLVEADDGKEHLRAMLAALQQMLGEE